MGGTVNNIFSKGVPLREAIQAACIARSDAGGEREGGKRG